MADRDGDAQNAKSRADRLKGMSEARRKLFEAVSGNDELLKKIRAERVRGEGGAPAAGSAPHYGQVYDAAGMPGAGMPGGGGPDGAASPPTGNTGAGGSPPSGTPPWAAAGMPGAGMPGAGMPGAGMPGVGGFGQGTPWAQQWAGAMQRFFQQAQQAQQAFGGGNNPWAAAAAGAQQGASPFGAAGAWPGMGGRSPFGAAGAWPGMGGRSPFGAAGAAAWPGMGGQSPFGSAGTWPYFGGAWPPFGATPPGTAPAGQRPSGQGPPGQGPSGNSPPWPGSARGAASASSDGKDAPPRPAWSPLVPMKPFGKKRPLFCIHAILGSAFPYQQLAIHLDQDQPLYGIQSRGLDGTAEPIDNVEQMAQVYIDAIRVVQPKGPYNLGGYSFGGAVALAMAQQLISEGEQIATLAMFGTGAPLAAASPMMAQLTAIAANTTIDLRKLLQNAFMAENPWAARGGQGGLGASLSPMQRVFFANQIASLRYVPRPFPGGVELFATPDQQMLSPADPTFGWAKLCTGSIRTHVIEGTHFSIFQEPQVRALAEKLTAVLNREDENA